MVVSRHFTICFPLCISLRNLTVVFNVLNDLFIQAPQFPDNKHVRISDDGLTMTAMTNL